jgi:hypothetical protein
VRPHGRKEESGMATESEGTNTSGTETTVDSLRSNVCNKIYFYPIPVSPTAPDV